MSCFIMKEEIIAGLADYIKTLNDFGYDYFGYSIPRSLNEALNLGYRSTPEKEIFKKLYAFNVTAFNNRYEADCDIDVEMPKDYKTLYHPIDTEKAPQPWEYQLLKTLSCYIYQVSEDVTIKTDLFKALKELEMAITNNIVWRMPEMKEAEWG